MKLLTRILLLSALCSPATTTLAHDYKPGPKQTEPILLKGGTLYTISDGVKENTDLLFVDGVITEIGVNLTAPEGAQVIDISGQLVYPGLIAAGTGVGLVEIGAVRATKDGTEVGSVNPDVQTHMAFNPDSEIIPTLRANGIAYAHVVPGGRLVRGRSFLTNLDCWTKEDGAASLNTGLHTGWPGVRISTGWWERRTPEEQREAQAEARKRLRQAFDDAKAYQIAKAADPNLKIDSRWEAMLPILSGDLPLFVHAGDPRQIEQAVDFADEFGMKLIIAGGAEAWRIADLLATNDIPLIYFNAHGMPANQDDDYDRAYKIPRLLHEAGVKFCFGVGGATGVRNMPFDAGQAVGFGLPAEVALRAMTLTTAEILGVEGKIGSLEIGKAASVIVSDGDIMDFLTHKVTRMFIDGRVVDLNSKHTELYEKYRHRKVD